RPVQHRDIDEPRGLRRLSPVVGRTPKRRLRVFDASSFDQHFGQSKTAFAGMVPILASRERPNRLAQRSLPRGVPSTLEKLDTSLHPAAEALELFRRREVRAPADGVDSGLLALIDAVSGGLFGRARDRTTVSPKQTREAS